MSIIHVKFHMPALVYWFDQNFQKSVLLILLLCVKQDYGRLLEIWHDFMLECNFVNNAMLAVCPQHYVPVNSFLCWASFLNCVVF